MGEHQHWWAPVPMELNRYVCSCGVTGYRFRGQIVQHKKTQSFGDGGQDVFVGRPNMPGGNARRGKRGPGGW